MEKQENENSMKLNGGGDPVRPCKFCSEKQEKESTKQDVASPYATPSISPTASLTSSNSCVSSCSDYSVDANSYGRVYQEEVSTYSSQEDPNFSSKGHLYGSSLPTYVNEVHRSNTMVRINLDEGINVNDRSTIRDAEIIGMVDGQEPRDGGVERASSSIDEEIGTSSCDYEMDAQFWLPPEPEDHEDDVEGSVTNFDDEDDECGDGVSWGKSSCLSSFSEEGSGSYKYKEEKQKAMDEVMNVKFKAVVHQLLESVGVYSSNEYGESWVDIVTSLSWEAASFVKPASVEGKAMDPDGYVKVKCIASGSRGQSQVIKGLVFKKHAAHKHMPTKYKNPRLLLIRGALDLSSNGLSSFESIKQDKDSLKSIIEMIEMCHPNVILVEKTVSRDIQESILAKGMTLVFDMKHHRLQTVARCTGSPILSSDILTGQKLRQCDSFHFEKFIEEHAASGEGGKKPSKTLMFLEGCATRLGCTILLRGTHNDELKRIKCVVRCAVVMAYHLILETSFLLDQRAMFATIPLDGLASSILTDQQVQSVGTRDANVSCGEESSSVKNDSSDTVDIPISNGFHEGPHNINLELEGESLLSIEPYNPVILSGLSSLSDSLKKVMGDSFRQSMSAYFGFDGRVPDGQVQAAGMVSSSLEATDCCKVEAKCSSDEEKAPNHEQTHSSSACEVPSHTQKYSGSNEEQMQSKDGISTVLDSESILVLMSSRNASRGTICEQSHFSHIKFYRNFDVPLGNFLRDNLLNQSLNCSTCGEPPEAHFYYYAHHNKQLQIKVRRLPMDKRLPGETEGKLWMWSCCGKCKVCNGNSKSTKRVLISTAARGLSFGKFLELSFSNHFSLSKLSSCGHSFRRDFLYFFGLGSMVAMFRYSPVATYSVSLPPEKLEFRNSIKGDVLKKDFEDVYANGISMFLEIENSLKEIGSRFLGLTLNFHGSLKDFSDIEAMLKQERYQFEVDIQNTIKNGNSDEAVYKLLSLNRIRWELLLQSCIWDRRLYSLLSSDFTVTDSKSIDKARQGQIYLEEDATAIEEANIAEVISRNDDKIFESNADLKVKLVSSVEVNDFPTKEIQIDGQVEGSREQDESFTSFDVTKNIRGSTVGTINANGSGQDVHSRVEDNIPPSDQLQTCINIPIAEGLAGVVLDLNLSQKGKSHSSPLSDLESSRGWIWTPFSEIQQEYMNDLQRSHLARFESIGGHGPESTARKLIVDEGSRLHIPLGSDGYMVSDYEDEFSSIIACTLALLKDQPIATVLGEDTRREKGMDAKAYESSHSLTRISSMISPYWSSIGSFDSDGIRSLPSISSQDSHLSSFDGLDLLDSLVSLGALHPEVSMGVGKLPGKGKYSVVCLYASQFHDLRNRSCPSELDYIASLSRCRNWDAKGGKSKSFFAKTLDDRFIIKEIKRTEFESFMKFAPDYFGYMNQCYELGNQTCLAKILGIYQVRQTKSGKETRYDLMVMENLTFGRNITRQYDLKGALHARFTSVADGSGDVLLDQNFVNDMNVSPLYVSRKAKRNLQRAVWNDTTFLNSINVMDYSLLVGVDKQQRELVCGIIDYLRQYTWDKQLENWVKSSLVVPKNQLPTIISPKEYKKRIRKFIDTHFLSVPDHWCSQRSSNPCKLCGTGGDDDDSCHSTVSRARGNAEEMIGKSHKEGKQNGFST